MQDSKENISQHNNKRLDLIERLWNKMKPEIKEDRLITSVLRMTYRTVDAAAASLLLHGETEGIYFLTAAGPAEIGLKRLHADRQSGIVASVVRNVKHVLVNDADKNRQLHRLLEEATGFRTMHAMGVPLVINGKLIGVIELHNKVNGNAFSQHDMQLLKGLSTTSAMALENARLNEKLMTSYRGTVQALVSLAGAKETSGGGHSRRVAEYVTLGAAMFSMSPKDKTTLEYAAFLHDIGKLSVPDRLLNKSGELTDEEWARIRRHPVVGYELLKDIPFLQEASSQILYHHERYDGKGYPQGLEGDAIPIGARLIAVADAFDHMTVRHSYREAYTKDQAFAELNRCVNSQFCPLAVKAFNAGFVKSRLSQKNLPLVSRLR